MWITVAKPSFTSLDQIDAVLAELDGPPDGMEARYIGTTAGGELLLLAPGRPVTRPIPAPTPRARPLQPPGRAPARRRPGLHDEPYY